MYWIIGVSAALRGEEGVQLWHDRIQDTRVTGVCVGVYVCLQDDQPIVPVHQGFPVGALASEPAHHPHHTRILESRLTVWPIDYMPVHNVNHVCCADRES